MVKRWGKSPPRTGQPGRHGKPHPEQCRIGASRGKVCILQRPPQGRFSPEARVGSLTAAVTRAAEEWSSMGGNPRDRIRLIGHPRVFCIVSKTEGGLAPSPPGAAHPQGIWAKMKPMPFHLGQNTQNGAKRRRPRRRPKRLAPHGARFDWLRVVWLLTLPVAQVKGGLQEISRGPCVSPM